MLRNPWFRVGVNAWSLGMEASSVIALRTLKIAAVWPQRLRLAGWSAKRSKRAWLYRRWR
jgi:hypothetical protein